MFCWFLKSINRWKISDVILESRYRQSFQCRSFVLFEIKKWINVVNKADRKTSGLIFLFIFTSLFETFEYAKRTCTMNELLHNRFENYFLRYFRSSVTFIQHDFLSFYSISNLFFFRRFLRWKYATVDLLIDLLWLCCQHRISFSLSSLKLRLWKRSFAFRPNDLLNKRLLSINFYCFVEITFSLLISTWINRTLS